jgi:hypothetical protein
MMNPEFNAVKKIFDKVLNANVTLKSDMNDLVKEEFLDTVAQLKEAYALESSLKDTVDVSKVTKVFWKIIKSNLEILYGEDVAAHIFSYVKSKRPKYKSEESLWAAVKEMLEGYDLEF